MNVSKILYSSAESAISAPFFGNDALAGIHGYVPEADDAAISAAAQRIADARNQLARAEGFCDVIVRADIEPCDRAALIAGRG